MELPVTRDGRQVRFTMSGFRESAQHSADPRVLQLVPDLPALIRRAVPLWSEPSTKADKPNILAFHHYGTRVRQNGAEFLIRITLRQDTDGHIYYDNHPTDFALVNEVGGTTPSQPGRKANAREGTADAAKDRLLQWLAKVNAAPDGGSAGPPAGKAPSAAPQPGIRVAAGADALSAPLAPAATLAPVPQGVTSAANAPPARPETAPAANRGAVALPVSPGDTMANASQPPIRSGAVLTSAALSGDRINLDFDATAAKPSREQLAAAFPDAIIEEMAPDVTSNTRGVVSYRITARLPDGRHSGTRARQQYEAAFGSQASVRGQSRFQAAGSLAERVAVGGKIAGDGAFTPETPIEYLDIHSSGQHPDAFHEQPTTRSRDSSEARQIGASAFRRGVAALEKRAAKLGAVALRRNPAPPSRSPGTERAEIKVSAESNGEITIDIHGDLFEALWQEAGFNLSRFHQRANAILREEQIHLAQVTSLRRQWIAAGRRGSFKTYLEARGREIALDISRAGKALSAKELGIMQKTLHDSYRLYFDAGTTITPTELWSRLATPFMLEKLTGGATPLLLEFTRMVIQQRRDAQISESAFRTIYDTLKRWGKPPPTSSRSCGDKSPNSASSSPWPRQRRQQRNWR